MKKILVSMLAISALVFTSCSDDDNDDVNGSSAGKVTKTINTSIYETASGTNKRASTMEFSYGNNGYISKITGMSESERPYQNGEMKKYTSTFEGVLTYNQSNQLIKLESKSVYSDEKSEEYASTFTYNSEGFVTKEENSDGSIITYEYNEKGLMSKSTKISKETESKNTTTYQYDTNGVLTKKNDIEYTFDNKINPTYNIFPENMALISADEMGAKYVVSTETYTYNNGTEDIKNVTEYQNTYNANGQLTKQVIDNSDPANGTDKDITTIEYFY